MIPWAQNRCHHHSSSGATQGQITNGLEQKLTFSRPDLKRLVSSQQANLAFDPAALLPGASPKSPGLKAVVSPFHSPPSTPSSPGVRSRASEPEEVPISFDQPPEGSHLPCYNKVLSESRVRGPSTLRVHPVAARREEDTLELWSGLLINRGKRPWARVSPLPACLSPPPVTATRKAGVGVASTVLGGRRVGTWD